MIDNEKRKKEIIENPIIKKIINDFNLNLYQIESGLEIFSKIIEEQKNIDNIEFLTSIEIYDEKNIVGISKPNKNWINEYNRRKYHILSEITEIENVQFANPRTNDNSKELKKKIFYWNHSLISQDNHRSLLASWLKEFYSNNKNNKYTKGLYIYGKLGVGKTYFLYALTNYLISKQKSVSFININDLFDFITKNMEKDNEYNTYAIQQLKNVDVLIIDDIGSEKQNSWFLFSILYPILEFRNKNSKTTFFSSFFSLSELKKYWLKNKELDNIKIERLIEKIKTLTFLVELKGHNIREL